ncbi:TrkA family potassium uptake protein [uncultured Propionibacterium sp.]|uniref:potassium channel family protein n=1 Tax=uncultured Propionibacterium sp. TaxID=218066 RepID=UPI002931C5DE|nr:TrkA family potassium uptake protein [uncultured Propionibacterium sp.]
MRVSITGAGNVGRSIARELIANGHEVLLIEKDPHTIRSDAVPEAEWLLADACEMDSLAEADLETCDVAIAATGDDKANLVYTLLAKTEFGVPRTVARVNHPKNEWMFSEQWGVDVAVSTPRIMSALVEEAVSVGAVVRLMTFNRSSANLVELTLPAESGAIGQRVRDLSLPGDGVLVAIIRDGKAQPPRPDAAVEEGDELLFTISEDHERELSAYLTGRS